MLCILFLSHWCYKPYSRKFHLYDGCEYYGVVGKPENARAKSAAIPRLLWTFPSTTEGEGRIGELVYKLKRSP